jgi:hypothetical protein
VTRDRQWLEGRLTFIGLIIAGIGSFAKAAGYDAPVDEAEGLLSWTLANWDDLAQLVGLLSAFYGRLRMNWRPLP